MKNNQYNKPNFNRSSLSIGQLYNTVNKLKADIDNLNTLYDKDIKISDLRTYILNSYNFESVEITANHTADKFDRLILADSSSGVITITLPPLSNLTDGDVLIIIKTDSSGNEVILDGDGSETINGSTTYSLTSQYDKVWVVATKHSANAWYII